MKVAKILGILVLVYVAIVVLFESGIGYFQPQSDGTLVISVQTDDGETSNRVLSRIEVDNQLYVAVNHWPRAWYYKVLDNPDVEVTIGDETKAYTAVEVTAEDEVERVNSARPLPIFFKILTGFPPRRFVRLDA